MDVFVFHGYLLRGTGSNVYNAELATALARLGHRVHLLAQERHPLELPWVDAVGSWCGGELRVRNRRDPARITVYRPPIGEVLPVYVADRYEGFDARPFAALSEAELASYLERNVAAVREVARLVAPGAALANHLIMGPAILARAGVDRYAVKVHGSALEYAVKPEPGRFLPYAREGLRAASGVLVGSRHTAESLWAAMDDPSVVARTRLGPPGVDVHAFVPRAPDAATAGRSRSSPPPWPPARAWMPRGCPSCARSWPGWAAIRPTARRPRASPTPCGLPGGSSTRSSPTSCRRARPWWCRARSRRRSGWWRRRRRRVEPSRSPPGTRAWPRSRACSRRASPSRSGAGCPSPSATTPWT